LASLSIATVVIGQGQVRLRVEASYIRVPVTAADGQGRTILGLTREDFEIYDEGERRAVENFVLDKTPLYVVLLLDVSGSVKEELEEVKSAALGFAGAFSKDDRIAVVSFADRTHVLQDWTNNLKDLKRSLKKLKPGYRTAFHDAVVQVVQGKLRTAPGKRVVILLTDGVDNESQVGFDPVVHELLATDVSVYIVSRTRLVIPHIQRLSRVEFLNRVLQNLLDDDEDFVELYFREKETALQHMAESTGGRVLYPTKLTELGDSYRLVADELKTQYVLTFRPPERSDRRFRAIRVVCLKPAERLHFRRQYAWSPPDK
jgi:Ca-activated chloride channel family protein